MIDNNNEQVVERLLKDVDDIVIEHRKNVLRNYLSLMASFKKLQTTDNSYESN